MDNFSIEKEIWKDIPDFEGLYQVSNFGRIKSLERKEFMARNNCYKVRKERVMDISKEGQYPECVQEKDQFTKDIIGSI